MKTRVKHRSVLTALLLALCAVIFAIIAIAVLSAPSGAALADGAEVNAHG